MKNLEYRYAVLKVECFSCVWGLGWVVGRGVDVSDRLVLGTCDSKGRNIRQRFKAGGQSRGLSVFYFPFVNGVSRAPRRTAGCCETGESPCLYSAG